MAKTLVVVSALAATAMARAPGGEVLHHIFVPQEYQDQPLVGSVVTAAPSVTEYILRCHPTAAAESCNMGTIASVTMRPREYEFNIEDGDDLSLNEKCSVGRDSALCIRTADGLSAAGKGITTVTKTDGLFSMVTITSGNGRPTDSVELRIRQLLEDEGDDDCSASGSVSHSSSSSTATSSSGNSSTTTPTYSASDISSTTKASSTTDETTDYSQSTTSIPTSTTTDDTGYSTIIPSSTSIVPHTDPDPTDVTTTTNVVVVTPSNSATPTPTTSIPVPGAAARPSQGIVLTGFAALVAAAAVGFL